ncbi:unnamed protein product [Didymodactylos carnosus]|uniref:Glutamate--cysteine ligase n=1 Tax=Didymodactylos carnosus TaxID=1234261 RepID=A0A8S2EUQ7_9BILA|nr:unnamed protein product [Didymodactylos carnosus]CAF4055077.1 unnamed protein product [Didymodactylos carnosus]
MQRVLGFLPIYGNAASPVWRGYLADTDCRWDVLSQVSDDRTDEERGQKRNRKQKVNFGGEDVDPGLSQHIAHLFVRDPWSVVEEFVNPKCGEEEECVYHFENLNSTVWNSLRFKPPPLTEEDIGWRIELRPMDLQLRDFENAALSIFAVLLTQTILKYKLNLLLPISKVDDNMEIAEKRDAVRTQKFYFRQTVAPELISKYFDLIRKRSNGTQLTNAMWMRQFIATHPKYQHDSIVTDEIQYDLMWKIQQLTNQ